MGMFDALKRGIAKFTGKVSEEATLAEDARKPETPSPSAPAPSPAPAPAPKPAAKKPAVEDDWEAELAAIEAEVEAESKPAPAPAPAPTAIEAPKPAPAVAPAPKPVEVAKPAPTPAPAPAKPIETTKASAPAPRPEPAAKPIEISKPAAPAPRPEPAKATVAAPAMEQPRPSAAALSSAQAPAEQPKPAPQPEPKPEAKPATFTPVEKPVAPAPAQKPAAPAPKPAAPAPAPKPQPAPQVPADKGKLIQIEKIDDLLWDLELSLLESDVALPVVEEIKESLKSKIAKLRVASADHVPAAVEGALRESLLEALSVEPIDFDAWVLEKTLAKKPVVVMFVGVNGTGKTTSIGRIAYRLKENGYTSVMAAGDTFRAGAIQQLEKHAEKVGVTLIKTTAGGDPAAVAFDAIEHAKSRMKDVVLLDTAGRMQTNTNLMDEMKKIKRVAKPDLIVFVGDSLAGNDAVEQAVQFDKAVGIDAVVLTKVDTDAKGGAALSIAKAVGKPVLFLGVGQEYADLIPYDPQWMVDRIFESG